MTCYPPALVSCVRKMVSPRGICSFSVHFPAVFGWKFGGYMCLLYRGILDWYDEIQWWCSHCCSNSFVNQLRRIAFAAIIFGKFRILVFSRILDFFLSKFKNTRLLPLDMVNNIITAVRFTCASWYKVPRNTGELDISSWMGYGPSVFGSGSWIDSIVYFPFI